MYSNLCLNANISLLVTVDGKRAILARTMSVLTNLILDADSRKRVLGAKSLWLSRCQLHT